MDSNSNNNKSIKRKVIDQLIEGYEFATQLKYLISHQTRIVSGLGSVVSSDPDPADELIAKILGSFHKTISVLDSFEPVAVSVPVAVEGSWNAPCGDDSTALASCNGGDSGDSRKKRLGVGKGKRGCYTRKKRQHTRIVKARSSEDKYAWRKYGQKEILKSNFPRSYFRCTHKPTQGCQALKKIQKLEQDPEMFEITYIGYHTCTATDQPQPKTESFEQETIIDSDKTFTITTVQNHTDTKVQEQDNNNSSVTMVSTGMVKEEDNYNGEGSSTGEDLSLVWHDDMIMFDDHQQQQHQNHYYCGENSSTFSSHDQFSNFFESYCAGW